MRRKLSARRWLMTLLVLGCVSAIAGQDVTLSLCMPQESTYFSCPVARFRSIAVCGAPGAVPQYRFGRPGAIEMRFPDGGSDAPMVFAHYSRYQTDRVEIRFSRQGTEYVVFDHVENGRERAGVRVTRGDAKEREIVCTHAPKARLAELGGVLACDRDSALNGGSCR